MKNLLLSFVLLSSLLPLKNLSGQTVPLNGPTSWDVMGNPFSQPNVTLQLGKKTFEWYGSGDVNNDEKINQLDLDAINSGVSNDRSDLDGDGVPSTQNDKAILENYLNHSISHLPGHWNELTAKEERISWLEKMTAIDKTDTISRANTSWICVDRGIQEQINFYGISNAQEFVQTIKTDGGDDYSLENLARFNIPVYTAGVVDRYNLAHLIMAALVGNDPKNFDDWYFFSAFNDSKQFPGSPEMIADSPICLHLEAYVQYDPRSIPIYYPVLSDVGMIFMWQLDNKVPTFLYNVPFATLNNPNIIKVHVG
jgi:hypothetical protein